MSIRKDVVAKSSAPKKITNIQFGTLLNEEIQRISEFEITSQELFGLNGIMDPRLGVSDKNSLCKTCKYVTMLTVESSICDLIFWLQFN